MHLSSVRKFFAPAMPLSPRWESRQRVGKLGFCIALGLFGTMYAFGSRLHDQAANDRSTFFSSAAPSTAALSRWATGSGAVNVRLDAVR